jgi:ParB family transcriptional regulator, chromosome partitioning protein
MSRSSVPKMRGVEAYLSDTSKIDQLESIALNTPPQYIDPRLLIRSPYQPRTSFLQQEMDELERSIAAAGGVKVPLIVRPGINEIIAGERRSIIAISRGDLLVPVFWHTCSDEEAAELAGFENVKRADLNAIDETNLVINMVKMRLKLIDRQTAIDLIQRVNYQIRTNNSNSRNNVVTSDQHVIESESRNNVVTLEQVSIVEKTIADFTKGSLSLLSFCSHKLKLLNLPTEVVEAIGTNRIEYTKGAEIAKIEDRATRNELLDRAVEEGLSVAQVKEEVAKIKPPKARKAPKQSESWAVDDLIIDLEGDSPSIAEPLAEQISNAQLGQSQPDLTVKASQIAETTPTEIDDSIQEITEAIRFKISNDVYSLATKQEIKGLLDRVMKLLK